MSRSLIFAAGLLLTAGVTANEAMATYNCDVGQGAKCHCAGGDNCKEMEKSGMCGSNSLLCTGDQSLSGSYSCDCTAKAKGVGTNQIKPKLPSSKSQN